MKTITFDQGHSINGEPIESNKFYEASEEYIELLKRAGVRFKIIEEKFVKEIKKEVSNITATVKSII